MLRDFAARWPGRSLGSSPGSARKVDRLELEGVETLAAIRARLRVDDQRPEIVRRRVGLRPQLVAGRVYVASGVDDVVLISMEGA